MTRTLWILLTLLPFHGYAQCYKDRHNTSWNEAWISCSERMSPSEARGNGHWILYDLGHTYRLGSAKFWNLNAPEFLESGLKNFYLDYGQNGRDWKNLGQFNLSQAPGISIYEGEDLTDFGGDTARFVLITAIDTWGGACAGLSEVKFEVVEVVSEIHSAKGSECFDVSIYPNPHTSEFNLSVNSTCDGDINYDLYDHTGRLIRKGLFIGDDPLKLIQINTGGIPSGMYHLVLRQKDAIARFPVVKI